MALKFAVVREDADLEAALVASTGARAALVVASGGCTALTLAARFPALRVAAFDVNPDQLAHVRAKADAARRGAHAQLNVDDASPAGLNQSGEFEGLFRLLRSFLVEFVAPARELEAFFAAADAHAARAAAARWAAARYWPAAFATCFHDALLHAMFGPAATQHAAPGSYPGYFQRVFERGLARDDARRNPFLQHVLLGRYLARDAPAYVTAPPADGDARVELVPGSLPDVPDLARFDVVSLSNVFDWSDDALAREWARLLAARLRPGSVVLTRALNNDRALRAHFAPPCFAVDDALGRELLARDRSLFYNRVEVARRTDAPA